MEVLSQRTRISIMARQAKKVYAVLTKHLDCPEYIYEDMIDVSVSGMTMEGLKRTAEAEGGRVELITEVGARKFMARYDARMKKEAAQAAKKAKAEAEKAAAKAAKQQAEEDKDVRDEQQADPAIRQVRRGRPKKS